MRTTVILEMPRFEFWLLAGFALVMALFMFFSVIVFPQNMIEKQSRDVPRLNTEARGFYTTPHSFNARNLTVRRLAALHGHLYQPSLGLGFCEARGSGWDATPREPNTP